MDYREQAKLYYLYMMTDGDVTDGEKKLFNKICKELNLDTDDKKNIKLECDEISKNEKMTCIEVVKKNVEETYVYGVMSLNFINNISAEDKAKILWNLINLGYADSSFTMSERKVVDYLRKYWKISDSLYQEMIDVAETCLALEKHKLWIEGLPDSEYKLEKTKQVKKDIKDVQKTIATTISEIEF